MRVQFHSILALTILFLLISGCAAWDPVPKVIPITERARQLEEAVFDLVNAYRQKHNLSPLTSHPNLQNEARRHSYSMAMGILPFGHRMFRNRIERIARTQPFSRASENVAYNQNEPDPAGNALQGWLASPGHRRNIEGNYDLTGIGVFVNEKGVVYYTQIFVAY